MIELRDVHKVYPDGHVALRGVSLHVEASTTLALLGPSGCGKTTTLAAFIGAGGLGEPIVTGLTMTNTNLVLSGALPAAVLALGVDAVLAVAERRLTPRGLRLRQEAAR